MNIRILTLSLMMLNGCALKSNDKKIDFIPTDFVNEKNSIVCSVTSIRKANKDDRYRPEFIRFYITPNPDMNNPQITMKDSGFANLLGNVKFIRKSSQNGSWNQMVFLNQDRGIGMYKFTEDTTVLFKINMNKENETEFWTKCSE